MKVAIVLALAILAVFACDVNADSCGGKDFGTAGDFDFYVFAQSWSAQFCTTKPNIPGCTNPTNWQQTNLTLHGMWPNYNSQRSGHGWPQCCQSKYGSDIDPSVVADLLPALQLYWPNEQDPSGSKLSSSLWAHEWNKHGTCSGLPQKAYLQEAMTIQLQIPTPSVITNNVGGSCKLKDLQAAYGATDCLSGGDCIVAFNCASDSGKLYLSSVTTCWDQFYKQIRCPASVLSSQGKQCTNDDVYILSF